MPTNFPTSADSFTNPAAGTSPDANGPLPHHAQHANANDAIAALEAKVGTTAQSNARVHVGPTGPTGTGNYVWVQTGLGVGGTDFTIWFEDGT